MAAQPHHHSGWPEENTQTVVQIGKLLMPQVSCDFRGESIASHPHTKGRHPATPVERPSMFDDIPDNLPFQNSLQPQKLLKTPQT